MRKVAASVKPDLSSPRHLTNINCKYFERILPEAPYKQYKKFYNGTFIG